MRVEFLKEAGRVQRFTSIKDAMDCLPGVDKNSKITRSSIHAVDYAKKSNTPMLLVKGNGFFVILYIFTGLSEDYICQDIMVFFMDESKSMDMYRISGSYTRSTKKNFKYTENMLSVAAKMFACCSTAEEALKVAKSMEHGKTKWKMNPILAELHEAGRAEKFVSIEDLMSCISDRVDMDALQSRRALSILSTFVNTGKESGVPIHVVKGKNWFALCQAVCSVNQPLMKQRISVFGSFYTGRNQNLFLVLDHIEGKYVPVSDKNKKYTNNMLSVAAKRLASCGTTDEAVDVLNRIADGKTSWRPDPRPEKDRT